MGPGTRTAWQHDARQLPDGDISFFDNGASPQIHPQSRVIVLSLDYTHRTATLVSSFQHPTPLLAGSQGDFEPAPGGDWITGWGQVPDFSLFSATGSLLFDAHLPSAYENYRTYWSPWVGTPTTPPSVAVRPNPDGHGELAYASWNGATQVSAWRVLAGASTASLARRDDGRPQRLRDHHSPGRPGRGGRGPGARRERARTGHLAARAPLSADAPARA